MMKRLLVTLSFAWAFVAGCSCGTDETGKLESRLEVDPVSLDFGEVTVGSSATRTFEVSNRGTAPLHVHVASTEAVYTVDPASAVVALDSAATFTVEFRPTEPGEDPVTGTIEIDSDGGTGTVHLSGRGLEGAVAITPAEIDFGDVARDRPDTARDDRRDEVAGLVRVFNGGSSDIEVLSMEFVDDAGGVFSGDFADALGVVEKGKERIGRVIFDPPDLATYEGALRVTTSSTAVPTFDIPLRGRGVAPVMIVCSSIIDDPESEICTEELPTPGGPSPEFQFGAFDELDGAVGLLRIVNEGNVPLEITNFRFVRESKDIVFYTDEDLQTALNTARLEPIICPADVEPTEGNRCAHQGELRLWVEYRARGYICCSEGVEECEALVPPGGTCSDVPNTDRADVSMTTNEALYRNLLIAAVGQSLIPQADLPAEAPVEISTLNPTFPVNIENVGPIPLSINGIRFSDPADDSCGAPPCFCDAAATPTAICSNISIAGPIGFPFEVPPGVLHAVRFAFDETTPGMYSFDIWWETNDPSQTLGRTRATVTVLP